MKTNVVVVADGNVGVREALALTEALGEGEGLSRKDLLHLRLLSEELFGMLRGIAGTVSADYWLEHEGRRFELHMKARVEMTADMKRQLLAASASGKNEAARGVMGKIRVMIANLLINAKDAFPYAGYYCPVDTMGGYISENTMIWSMTDYRREAQKHLGDGEAATEEWDELERSIVANIADDVKVRIVGRSVEIIVYKNF